MDALTIRKYRGMVRYPEPVRTEKASGSTQTPKITRSTGLTVSETLQQLIGRVGQAENHIRESHRTLQTGEAVLDEVQSSLERIGELAQQSANGGEIDRAALQKELEQLRSEIDRMISSASAGGVRLFLDGEDGLEEGVDALLYAIMHETSSAQDGVQALPQWLLQGIAQDTPSARQLLAALGLDESAGSADILAAIAEHPPQGSSATAYLAALYLGTVIAGGDPTKDINPQEALEGLRQLLEKTAEGVSPDEAIAQLTDGAFASLADFEAQFTGGMAPGMEDFLINLLLTENTSPLLAGVPVLTLLAEFEGIKLDLMMALLDSLQNTEAAGIPGAADGAVPQAELAGTAFQTSGDASAGSIPSGGTTVQFGSVQVTGQDISSVSFDASTGLLTIGGTADITIRGTGQDDPAILLTGSGTVTLRSVNAPALTVQTAAARIISEGGNTLQEIHLPENAALTIGGGGRLETGSFKANSSNVLRLTEGAVVVAGKDGQPLGTLPASVVIEGAASLAAHAASVSSTSGRTLEPFDIIWKVLLPGWNGISAMSIDGQQAKTFLLGGNSPDPARLWLDKGDPSHGYPIHTVAIRGRDASGRPMTRYAYLRWNRQTEAFEELNMYPNPFTITGGEEHLDWTYEASSATLRILSNRVTAISGGIGTDAGQSPFSGRVSLADSIGPLELSLGGVVCRVSSGRALNLGRGNHVTLILQSGSRNHFESGAGCAGISLRDGASLCIDCAAPHSSRDPSGTLTASGGDGGAGIGRDSGGSRDQTSHILIRGGVITATGTGGGAGIGAGKHSYMGPVTILGGTITATGGKGGGAGIGGALGAPVGDILIRGGTVTATAEGHAAAIGAGMQGSSGSIHITGSARIIKALGGDPGADIGASLFGGCGEVHISGGADIGCARLRQQSGVPLRMGGDKTVTLPQFRLSPRSLRLDRLSVLTREYARDAVKTIDADRRWIAQIQSMYSALYTQLEQSRLHNTRQYVSMADGMVRDTGTASTLLRDTSQSISLSSSQAMSSHGKRSKEDVRRLLW